MVITVRTAARKADVGGEPADFGKAGEADGGTLSAHQTRLPIKLGYVPVALVAIALIFWLSRDHGKPPLSQGATPAPVTTSIATRENVPIRLSEIGAAQAWNSAMVRAQVSGRLLSVPVHEGVRVRQGDTVALLDPAPFEAALTQAEGALLRDEAMLKDASVNLARFRTLLSENSIARQTEESQEALVEQYKGTVKIDQGAVAAARVNLGYTRIRAPFDGRVGVRNVDPGNLVSPTDANGIVILNQVTPIAVTFDIAEGDFSKVRQASRNFGQKLGVDAFSQETGEPLGAGAIDIADDRVDPSTGTVALKARFPNTDEALWPGQLVNVKMTLGTLNGVVCVPSRAVNQGATGPFVYVVKNGRAVVAPVRVKAQLEGKTAIASGVFAGQTVVVDGQMGLRPDAPVRARPDIHAQSAP